jgi:hypothetical protein
MPTIGHRLAFAAPFLGYALFFRASFKQSMESRQRRAQFETDRRQATEEALHTCEQCGASDQSDPERDFRYKSMEDDMVCLCTFQALAIVADYLFSRSSNSASSQHACDVIA